MTTDIKCWRSSGVEGVDNKNDIYAFATTKGEALLLVRSVDHDRPLASANFHEHTAFWSSKYAVDIAAQRRWLEHGERVQVIP